MKSTPITLTPIASKPIASTVFNLTPFSSFVFFLIKVLSFVLVSMLVFSCSKEKDGVYFSETPNDVIVSKVSYSEIELEIIDLSDNWLRSNEHKKIIEDSG